MKDKLKRVLFIILVSLPTLLSAQPYTFKRLGVEFGLSNNNVLSITQDKLGFLWFATEEGLNKFNGARFINYYKYSTQSPSISGNELNCVYADKVDSIIWIATQRSGLNAYNYNNNTFTVYKKDPSNKNSLITNDVTSVTNASDGNLWISTYYGGVDYFDKKTGKFTHYNKSTLLGLKNESVWTVMEDNERNLFIGHVNEGLSILSLKDNKVRNFKNNPQDPTSIPGNDVKCIFNDKNNNIWVGTNNGLALFNAEKNNFTVFRNNNFSLFGPKLISIFSIQQINNNQLWIATEFEGIFILDIRQLSIMSPDKVQFQHISSGDNENQLSASTVRSIFQDSFHNIWIGTYGGGINFISNNPPRFNVLNYNPILGEKSKLSYKVAWGMCTDKQGKLWIGTDGGGINVYERGKRIAIYNKENGALSNNSVLSLFNDSQNNIWIGTFFGGVNCYNTKSKQFKQVVLGGKTKQDIRCFFEDLNHNLWVGSDDGIYRINLNDQNKITNFNTKNSGLKGDLVRSIFQDSKGRMWIGTFGNGLGIYTPQMKLLKNMDDHAGFCSNTINHIFKDSRNRIWVATGDGLVLFPSVSSYNYRTFKRSDGLANSHIRAITEDNKKNIWISTNKGLCKYSEAKNKFENYDISDGIPAGNFMSGSITKDKDGFIYFGSLGGVCYFNPEHFVDSKQYPNPIISELKIYNKLSTLENDQKIIPLGGNKEIDLNYKENSFSITFNELDYSLDKQVEYSYMLKGLNDSWYTLDEGNNSATFLDIAPGDYEFLIKARLHNQEWREQATSIFIHIAPPFWLTWWARILYVIILIAIIYISLHVYNRRINWRNTYQMERKKHEQEQELNNERLRFYTNITHELRTPLTLIIGPLEDMMKEKSLQVKQAHKISVIHQSAIRLLNLINQILEFRKTETQNRNLCVRKDNIAELIQEIGLKYKELNRKPNVDFNIVVEKEDMSLVFDKEVVTIILDNFISNAIKYTEKGAITISLYSTLKDQIEYTEIKVSDTGYGIEPNALPRIFERYYQANSKYQASGTGIGLALVKNLAELHEGEIWVESSVGKGSDFFLRLLTHNTYPNALHADVQETDEPKSIETTEVESGSEKQILLVVEDNPDIREYICETFSEAFEVISAEDGKKGLEQAVTIIPDIIISDIMMPEMDGVELCKRLKQDVRTSHIPIILLTAKDSMQDKEDGYTVGADSYITKPFNASLLKSRVSNLLELRKKLAALFSSGTNIVSKQEVANNSLNKLDNEFIKIVTQYIEADLSSDKIDVTYLSDKMCMSSSTLYRKMKALTNLSTNEYIRKVKMQNAERLLLEGKYKISEVAYKVGFNNVVYFRQCFKDEYGIAPSEYVKRQG
ncbi:two-component regulator propeller domain-containing protein [uncultured Bacteroides sp.]|uniref:hybrid sensor histidine kinase/response regulator transcription factor n=1 Tax=uncultured Bacteroides sp. TaxID=162156 RepID=UPI002AA84A0E|nr:two-component regulator propeller domain-containing protein [uncultured Bacteroides sp.]